MSSQRVKLGVVGCGAIPQMTYLPSLSQPYLKDLVQLVAVCDVSAERARAVGERYGATEIWTDFDEMIGKTAAEAILIITPIPFHFHQGCAAIAAGKHVYVQKTIAMTYPEAREMIDRAEKAGVVLAAAPGQMLLEPHRVAKELIDSGRVGKVCFARGMGSHPGHENVDTQGTDPSWYYKPGGGPVMDVAVYPLHSLTGLLGPVKRVTAFSGIVLPDRTWQGNPIDVQMDDSTLMLLDFGDSVFAELNGTFCQRALGLPQFELFAERGVIRIGGWSQREVPLEVYSEEDVFGSGQKWGWHRPDGLTPRMDHTVADLVHFAECIREGRKPVNSAAHAAHVVEVIEKGYLAAKTGQAQNVESTF